jgi:hypothetical protein
MAQQTAVEWLVMTLALTPMTDWYNVLEKAKAMEKEQREASYIEGAEMAKKVFKEELQEFIVLPKDCIN